LRYTQYSLDDTGTFKTSPSRVLPELSLDSGLFLERDTNLFGSQYLQTQEPRLFYLYIPEENQDDLPVFDTSNYDFSFNQLFRGDRFNGPDRMGDSNQFTLAVTSRLINHRTGKESVYASFGQIYYLEDREVTLPGGSLQDESTSPLVAEIGTTIINDLRLRGSLQWNPDNNETEKMVASVQYKPAPQKVVNLSYRVRSGAGIMLCRNDVHWIPSAVSNMKAVAGVCGQLHGVS
jgi:LPS-assembly protein